MPENKHVKSAKKRWSKLSSEQKKKYMKPAMKGRWSGVGKKKRSEQGKKMALIRWGKITK